MKTYGKATDLITFSRASTATYLGSSGLIETAAANEPRVEYDASGNVLGLLVEESRTNLLTYSVPATGFWLTGASTITSASATAPDGTVTAALITEGSSSTPYITSPGASLSNGAAYTYSFYVKSAGRSVVRASLVGSTTFELRFDASTETLTVVSAQDSGFEAVGDGWYRVWGKGTEAVGASRSMYLEIFDNVADGGQGIYIWGAQLEAGAFPTSYIPTSGATATRSADVASIATSEFGYRADEGTVVVEGDFLQADPNHYFWDLSSSASDRMFGKANPSQSLRVLVGGVDQANIGIVMPSANTPTKISYGLKKDSIGIARDGNAATVDTNGSIVDSGVNDLQIGSSYLATAFLNGHIHSLKYYPRRLTNAQLQELTS